MVIEAWINGEKLTEQIVPDEEIQDSEGLSWEQNCDIRSQIIGMYLEQFQKKMEKVFKESNPVQYMLVFQSKMNK